MTPYVKIEDVYDYGSRIKLPCGSEAVIDPDSGTHSYVCQTCFAVYGSISMPKECRNDMEKETTWLLLQKQ